MAEIVAQTPALILGYFQRSDLTASDLSGGWYRTGDVGMIDEAGAIILNGRVKDEINRAGFKIHTVDIDSLLKAHSYIAESWCFEDPDPGSNEIVSVAARLTNSAYETRESFRMQGNTKTRPQTIPERWYFVDEIPRTERGKASGELIRQSIVRNSRNQFG